MWRLKSTALVTPGPELRSRGREGVCLAGSNTGPKHTAKFCGVMRLWVWKEETRRRWSRRRVSVACGESCQGGHEAGKPEPWWHLQDSQGWLRVEKLQVLIAIGEVLVLEMYFVKLRLRLRAI